MLMKRVILLNPLVRRIHNLDLPIHAIIALGYCVRTILQAPANDFVDYTPSKICASPWNLAPITALHDLYNLRNLVRRKLRVHQGAALANKFLNTNLIPPPQRTVFAVLIIVGCIFIIALTIGPLAWLMLQYVTGGAWGLVIRRTCEAATRTLPLVLAMFLPIVIGINNLYPWARAVTVAADPLLKHKAPYLNVPFFLGRAAFYFAGWMFLAWWFNRWSLKEDTEGHDAVHGKMSG